MATIAEKITNVVSRRNKLTPPQPTPPRPSEMERLTTLVGILKAKRELYQLDVRAGERDQAEVDALQQRIDRTQREIDGLETTAAYRRQMDERRVRELPALEEALQIKVRHAVRELIKAREAFQEIRTIHDSILAFADPQMPGFNVVRGLVNRDLVSACGSGGHVSILREFLGKNELIDRWLRDVRQAGIEE